MLSVSAEQLQDLLHAELARTALSAFNGLMRELALLFLEVENSLFDGVLDSDLIDDHIDFLGESMDSVDCLFFNELCDVSS